MKFLRGSFAFILALYLSVSNWSFAGAQDPNYEYFPQTGHSVQNEFLRFYRASANPTILYGYPITEAFTGKDGKKVQYFQRARFELNPDLPTGQQVALTDIGREVYTPGAQLNVFSPFACRQYTQTNYPVCFSFLEFFDKNGGVAQFGYPISPFEYHGGVIVQYFEKARMEWQPSKPEGQRVVLADLGRIYFDKLKEDAGLLTSVPSSASGNLPSSVISLQVRAFVWKAMTMANDQQLVFMIVQDQRGASLAGAECAANVRWPDGRNETASARTNSNGVAIASLNVITQPYGNLVFIDAACVYNTLSGRTTTSFRIWY